MDFGLSTIFSIIQGIGTFGQVIGGIGQASSQARAYDDRAKAVRAQAALQFQADKKEAESGLAKNQARTEAGGIASGSGSPLEFELDNAFTAGKNRALRRWASEIDARSLEGQAASARAQIPGLIFEGLTQGASHLGKWYKASKTSNPFAGQKADVSWSGYT